MTRTAAWLGVVVVTAATVAGCADPADQDPCASYAALTATVDDLRELAQAEGGSASVAAEAAAAKAQLNQLEALSEDRLDAAASRLRTAVDDLQLAAGSEAQDTAAPLLSAAVDDVRDAFAALAESLDTQCTTG
ncbi:hypothetical protein [Cellulomonas sp.]|uniref:hypothetical protein n=1 Tax=Cellulomonas sp. TaxID=40001 RepID=UPI003BAB5AA0